MNCMEENNEREDLESKVLDRGRIKDALEDEAALASMRDAADVLGLRDQFDTETESVKAEVALVKKDLEEKKESAEKTRPQPVAQTITNALQCIEDDPELAGKIGYNELTYSPYITGKLPWMDNGQLREWTNADDAHLRQWLEQYGVLRVEKIMDAFEIYTHKHIVNPIRETLIDIRLHHWDGKTGHIRQLLPNYLGVVDDDYQYQCMKLVMIGAVKRIFRPGCKFDQMMILVGPQGIGKSQFVKTLALHPEWYADNFNTFEPEKATAMLRGLWIIEVAELLAAKRAREVESIKAFLTSTEDIYREPYARRSEHRPRRCVFIGTTNDESFLTDRTGNRRFLPIATGVLTPSKSLFGNQKVVEADFMNAWGEALDIYLQNEDVELILPKEAAAEALEQQNRYLSDDVRVGMIQQYLDNKARIAPNSPICVAELYQKALNNMDRLPARHESNELHAIMRNSITGWKPTDKVVRCGVYGPQRAYVRADSSEFVTNEFTPISSVADETDGQFQ